VNAQALPASLRDPSRADSVPWFIVSVLPPGVRGLLIAAIVAAAMSAIVLGTAVVLAVGLAFGRRETAVPSKALQS
jgi:Na+/proline symporter